MQETKKTYTIHAPQSAGTDIFNKDKYILKVVSDTEETAEIILEEIIKDSQSQPLVSLT